MYWLIVHLNLLFSYTEFRTITENYCSERERHHLRPKIILNAISCIYAQYHKKFFKKLPKKGGINWGMLQFAAKLEIPTIQSITIILSRQIHHLTFSGSCHHEQSAKLILECSEKQQKYRKKSNDSHSRQKQQNHPKIPKLDRWRSSTIRDWTPENASANNPPPNRVEVSLQNWSTAKNQLSPRCQKYAPVRNYLRAKRSEPVRKRGLNL